MNTFSRLAYAALALAATLSLATKVSAAAVELYLQTSVPNQFTIYAYTSLWDNAGIAAYDVPLIGNVLTLDHRSPTTLNGANFSPAGFSLLRTPDISSLKSNPEIRAGQDVFGPQENLVYGFGQSDSNWAANGISALGSSDITHDDVWSNPFVLATGTYSGPSLSINTNSINLFVNLFTAKDSNATTTTATINTLFCLACNEVVDSLIDNVDANNSGLVSHTFIAFPSSFIPTPTWGDFGLDSFVPPGATPVGPPAIPATFDPATHNFNWNPSGSAPGYYTWHVTRSFPGVGIFPDVGYITVHVVAVPEPGCIMLLGVATLATFPLVRRRS